MVALEEVGYEAGGWGGGAHSDAVVLIWVQRGVAVEAFHVGQPLHAVMPDAGSAAGVWPEPVTYDLIVDVKH